MDCQKFGNRRRFETVLSSLLVAGTIFSAVTCAVSSPALAQSPTGAPEASRGSDPLSIYKEAGVSTEQEDKIRDLVKAFEADTTTRIDSLRKLLKEMRDLSLTPAPDEAAVLAKQDEINKTQNDIASGRIKLLLKIRSMLSKEQKQKLVDLMQKSPAVNQ